MNFCNSKSLNKFLRLHKLYECELCFNKGEYLGKPLKLQIDHINGDSCNNDLSNLRFLCPNCHSQTDTYAGKNAKYKECNKPSKEEFIELFKKHTIKEIALIKAVSVRTVYQWFKFFIKEDKKYTPLRKLTCEQVYNIRNSSKSSDLIGKEYNVSGKLIRSIRRLESYKDCN